MTNEVEWEIHYQLKGHLKEGVYGKKYKRKGYAKRVGKLLFSKTTKYHWWLVGRPIPKNNDINDNFAERCREIL